MKPRIEMPACEICRVKNNSLFIGLDDKEFEELSFNKGFNFYKKGQIIFHEGSRPIGLYCINSGKIKVYKLGDEGKEQIVRLAKEGDILGYRALIEGDVYAASSEALEDAYICFIPKSTFFEFVQSNRNLSLKVMQLLSHDLKNSEERMTKLAQKPVRERVAEALLILKHTYGLEADESTLNISLTRDDLANIVGTASASLIRLLSEFNKDNIIELQGKKIKIINMQKLTHLANLYD